MSNLPAPIDPNLLPAYRDGLRAPYSQDIFLIELELEPLASPDFLAATPADHRLVLRLHSEAGLQALTEGGTVLGNLPANPVLERLLEAGKPLVGRWIVPQSVGIWLLDT
jgi:hypothetical protein